MENMIPHKPRAWDMSVKPYTMQIVEGINWHGDGVWFNEITDDETATDWCHFEDCILMDYTMLKDCNKQKIYDADVVLMRWTQHDILEPFLIFKTPSGEWRVDDGIKGTVLKFRHDDVRAVSYTHLTLPTSDLV